MTFRRRVTEQHLLRILERERAAFADERRHLLDLVSNLAGKPWTLPPRQPDPPASPAAQAVDDGLETLY